MDSAYIPECPSSNKGGRDFRNIRTYRKHKPSQMASLIGISDGVDDFRCSVGQKVLEVLTVCAGLGTLCVDLVAAHCLQTVVAVEAGRVFGLAADGQCQEEAGWDGELHDVVLLIRLICNVRLLNKGK